MGVPRDRYLCESSDLRSDRSALCTTLRKNSYMIALLRFGFSGSLRQSARRQRHYKGFWAPDIDLRVTCSAPCGPRRSRYYGLPAGAAAGTSPLVCVGACSPLRCPLTVGTGSKAAGSSMYSRKTRAMVAAW